MFVIVRLAVIIIALHHSNSWWLHFTISINVFYLILSYVTRVQITLLTFAQKMTIARMRKIGHLADVGYNMV